MGVAFRDRRLRAGLVLVTGRDQQLDELLMRGRVLRTQADGVPQRADRVVVAPESGEREPEVVARLGKGRVELRGAMELAGGIRGVALAEKEGAEVVARDGEVGLQRDRSPQLA